MHYLVGRLTALPPVTGIRAYHSEHAGTIFFYDYKIIDLMNDVIIEDMFIMDHITNKHQIFRGFQSSKIEEPKIEPMADQQVNKKNETNSNLNEWTFIELLIIFMFIVISIGWFILMFEYFNWYFINEKDDGSLFRSLMDILFVCPIMFWILAIIIFIYKKRIKMYVVMCSKKTLIADIIIKSCFTMIDIKQKRQVNYGNIQDYLF